MKCTTGSESDISAVRKDLGISVPNEAAPNKASGSARSSNVRKSTLNTLNLAGFSFDSLFHTAYHDFQVL